MWLQEFKPQVKNADVKITHILYRTFTTCLLYPPELSRLGTRHRPPPGNSELRYLVPDQDPTVIDQCSHVPSRTTVYYHFGLRLWMGVPGMDGYPCIPPRTGGHCRVPAVDLADGLPRDRCRLRGFHRQGHHFRVNRGAFQRVWHRPTLRRR